MRVDEYVRHDAVGLAALIASGEVSAYEVGSVALDALASVQPALNCVVESYPDRVDQLRRQPSPSGPLGGVPYLIKDLGEYEAGSLSENGSLLTEGYRAPYDTYATLRCREAGLVTIGRSTVPEWAWSIACRTRLHVGRSGQPHGRVRRVDENGP